MNGLEGEIAPKRTAKGLKPERLVWLAIAGFTAFVLFKPASHETTSANPQNPPSWTDGWKAATGDCDRRLPYGYSAVLVARNAFMAPSYKASYYDGYMESWKQGDNLGYCVDPDDAGVAQGADLLPIHYSDGRGQGE
jgi:hypothetical protein